MSEDQKNSMHPVHLLFVGPFGEAVCKYLLQIRSDVKATSIQRSAQPGSDQWPKARIRLLASWRPVFALCRHVDDLSFQDRTPFVPLTLDSILLQLGPIVMPGSGPCWSCWERRSLQHEAVPSARSALWNFYDEHDTSGPRGYLEPFALMGASRLSQTVDALDRHEATPGLTWQINLLSRTMETSFVMGVDGCPHCGSGRLAAVRSFEGLKNHLGYLWTNDGTN